MALTCEDVLCLVDEQGPTVSGDVRAHVEACPRCREALGRQTRVQAELRSMGTQEAPPFLHGRVMAHVRSQRRASPWRFVWAPALATALVAALVVWHAPVDAPHSPSPLPAFPSARPSAPPPPAAAPASSPLGPLRGPKTPEPAGVLCVLTDAKGLSRPLHVPGQWAPPDESEWSVVAEGSGEVRPAAGGPAIPFETLEILASLDLAPGPYVLRRAPRAPSRRTR